MRAAVGGADFDYADPDSNAARWQDLLLSASSLTSERAGTAFPIGRGFGVPLSVGQLARTPPVWKVGTVDVGCEEPGYVITGLDVQAVVLRRHRLDDRRAGKSTLPVLPADRFVSGPSNSLA